MFLSFTSFTVLQKKVNVGDEIGNVDALHGGKTG